MTRTSIGGTLNAAYYEAPAAGFQVAHRFDARTHGKNRVAPEEWKSLAGPASGAGTFAPDAPASL